MLLWSDGLGMAKVAGIPVSAAVDGRRYPYRTSSLWDLPPLLCLFPYSSAHSFMAESHLRELPMLIPGAHRARQLILGSRHWIAIGGFSTWYEGLKRSFTREQAMPDFCWSFGGRSVLRPPRVRTIPHRGSLLSHSVRGIVPPLS